MIENYSSTTDLFKKLEDKSGFSQNDNGSLIFPVFKTIHLDSISINNNLNDTLIKDLTLNIEKNSRIGFAGLQKEQRTAMGLLLSCSLTPDMGELRFDNTNARSLNINLIPKEITFVSERFEIMPDSFKNIICNYTKTPDWPRMLDAAKNTNIHAKLLAHPNCYELFYDPDNNSFDSVFQYLLGITRSVYLGAKTLILEEPIIIDPTQNQDLINSVYEKTLTGKTIVFLGGCEATLSSCDKIYLFENKRVIASGTHKTLSQDYPGYHLVKNQ
jgi:ABC-type multidrug transport system fused ATPase/permease subunit